MQSFLSKYLFPFLSLLLLAGISVVFWHYYQTNEETKEQVALEDAKNYATSVAQFRNFYAKKILPSLKERDVPVSHDYLNIPGGAAPLPATFAKEFGRYLSTETNGYKVRLYSDLPFKWREAEHSLDQFQQEAMNALKENPTEDYWRIEVVGGQRMLRYARADRLKVNCVACHNTYPGTPRTDWVAGDVRGVLEVQRPMGTLDALEEDRAWQSFMMMLGLALTALLITALLMNRLQAALKNSQKLLEDKTLANERLNVEIEQRSHITSELLINQNKTMAVMNSVSDVIVVIDTKGTVIEVNRTIEEMFGYSPAEVVDSNIKMLMPSPHHEKHDEYLLNYSRTRKRSIVGTTRRVDALKKSGEIFTVDLSVSEIQINDSILFTGVIRDVSGQVSLEREMQKARDDALLSAKLKSEFLANMSHEIRTPMNGVIGMSGLLLDTNLNSEQRSLAETISSSASSLLHIINDILDFSKIEAGKLEINAESHELLEVIESAMDVVTENAYGKKLRFGYFVDPRLPKALKMDAIRIRQILVNLLGNAIKFTEQGHVILRVMQRGDELYFEVEDTGIGIPKEAKERMFEAFSQVDGSTTRIYGGTGLGLTISRQLVSLMHGHIGLESELGKGSTFWFSIPFNAQSLEPCVRKSPEQITLKYLIEFCPMAEELKQELQLLNVNLEIYSNSEDFCKAIHDNTEHCVSAVDLTTIENQYEKPEDKISEISKLGRRVIWSVTSQQRLNELYQSYLTGLHSIVLIKPLKIAELVTKLQRMSLELQQKSDQTSPKTVSTLPENINTALESGQTILLVEDNLVNQKLALTLLKKMGYEADLAENGQNALDMIAEKHYDLILMDCQMPIKDGYQTTRELREWDHVMSKVPIVAMTANAMKGDDEKCYAAGMDDYMTKPIDPKILKAKIEKYLNLTQE